MEAFIQEFKEECEGLFQRLEACLLEAEGNPTKELVDEIYRHLHTLKGGAGMFGLASVEELAHELENLFSEVQAGVKRVDGALVNSVLQSVDTLKGMLTQSLHDGQGQTHKNVNDEEDSKSALRAANCFAIVLKPEENIFKRGVNFKAVLEEIQGLGKSRVIIHEEIIPFEQQLERKQVTSTVEILLCTQSSLQDVNDVLLFLRESEKGVVALTEDDFYNDAYQSLVQLRDAEVAERRKLLQQLMEPIVNKELSLHVQDVQNPAESSVTQTRSSFINVATSKLDHLVNVVSELVIFRSELQHLLGEKSSPALMEAMEKLDRLTLSLRDSAFSIRLVPLNTLSVKLQRLVRTLSQELNKEVEFIMEGLHTELDRSMIHALEAPLMHLIRNAMDHGIESPEERIAQNKPARGLLKLYSYNSGDHVFIQLQDDGRGIDFSKIKDKAVAAGMLKKDHDYTEKELLQVMMMPGFSTADKVSTVSGRGVGLDVVKKEIASLRGDIEISTEQNLGSIFTLRLPLTLTVLDTLVVNVANSKYLLPINEIEHCYTVSHEELFSRTIRQVNYRGQLLPFISLREHFNSGDAVIQYVMIIINKNDRKMGIVVDGIAGSLQTVYKPLNELLHSVRCFSGASILGDGTMAFIIDPLKLTA